MNEIENKRKKFYILGVIIAVVVLFAIGIINNSSKGDTDSQQSGEPSVLNEVEDSTVEEQTTVVEDVIVSTMMSEEMFFYVDDVMLKWENGELNADEAINMLKDFTEVEFDEVVAFTQGKIELITLEENAKQSYVTAEDFYNQEKYYEALQKLRDIPSTYSKYEEIPKLVNLCQKNVLEMIKDPDTVEAYEQAIEYVAKCDSLFQTASLSERKQELEEELVILKEVLGIIQTATEMYDGKKYEEAFAMLLFGLEQYSENELLEEKLMTFHDHFIIQTTIEVAKLCETESYNEALELIDAAILEYDCQELQELKINVREEKNYLYKLKNDVVEAFKYYANEFTSEEFDVKHFANNTGAYIVKSGKKLILGDYTEEEVTVLALTGNVAASLAGVDAFMDIRDLSYDITHWGEEEYFVARLAVDVVALIPVIGMIKYLDHYKVAEAGVDAAADMVDSVADVGKNTEATADAIDTILDTAKPAYKVLDAADAAKDAAKTRKMVKTIKKNASKGYKFVQTRNYQLLGAVHENTGVEFVLQKIKYSNGDMIQGVFPKFKSFSDVDLPKSYYKSSFDDQKEYCLKELQKQIKNPFSKIKDKFSAEDLKAINEGVLPEGFTWHHNEKEGLMQLVKTSDHAKTSHTGGMSLWGRGYD